MSTDKVWAALAYLPQRASVKRFCAVVSIAVIAAVGLSIAAIRSNQAALRRDIEKLFQDISCLQPGTTTEAEARRLMKRWAQGGAHQSRNDGIQVELSTPGPRQIELFSRHPNLLYLYRTLGGRPAKVRAAIAFAHGVISYESVGVFVDGPRYELIGGATYIPKSEVERASNFLRVDKLHPTYIVHTGGGCSVCVCIGVTFLPDVDVTDARRLMHFDLSCLTRWHPCSTQGDIMPAVWRQYLEDETHR